MSIEQMGPGRSAAATLVIAALVHASPAAAGTTAAARFDEAARDDLAGKPQLAFAAYLDAAKAGLPDAELNVAIMLDSGRGVTSDMAAAAAWYARAAAHGIPRAAYNLGLLYEDGEGVPRNAGLARAWFEASGLPAASRHLASMRRDDPHRAGAKAVPALIAPAPRSSVDVMSDGIELVWTSTANDEPTQYYVEVDAVDKAGSKQVFSFVTKVSSVYVDHLGAGQSYVWRVTALKKGSGDYVASAWSGFST